MKSSKEKRIKEIKKIHVLPHIILLIVFVTFLTVVLAGFMNLFITYTVENHLEGSYQRAQVLSETIEQEIKSGKDATSLVLDQWPGEDIAIYDNTKHDFVILPKQQIELTNCVRYTFYENTTYFDKVNGEGLESLGEEKVGFSAVLYNSIRNQDNSWLKKLNTEDEELVQFHAWIEHPLADEKYSLYYSSDVILRSKDMIYVIMFCIIVIIAVSVPLILYIVTLIISLMGQRRTARYLYFDAVTGGKNWLYFTDKSKKIIRRCKPGKRLYAMVSLRMERYQGYCACYGVAEGEAVVEQINRILRKALKRNELYARYTEAEFGLLMAYDTPERVMARLNLIREELVKSMEPHKIDFNLGICEAHYKMGVDELYSNASIARKSIPAGTSEKLFWFNEKLKEDQLWERFVEENMERALAAGELHVYLQPKYNAETKRLGGAEALIRWISPTEGFIGPGKFIPIFEKNGFITKIDDFMLRSVARLQAQWVREGKNVVPVSVNISRAHFTQEDLAEHICRIVEEEGAPKELIELELTESAFFEDKETLINTVERLKAMGFAVSMDDFGAGYSSLNSLKDLQLDVLKIDADFFRGKEENEERGSLIVSETIRLAKNLGMTTVAEGIESAEQVEFLARNGCDLIQGFYFAKPMPVADYELKMEEDASKSIG